MSLACYQLHYPAIYGAGGRTRIRNILITSEAHYLLCYASIYGGKPANRTRKSRATTYRFTISLATHIWCAELDLNQQCLKRPRVYSPLRYHSAHRRIKLEVYKIDSAHLTSGRLAMHSTSISATFSRNSTNFFNTILTSLISCCFRF